MAGPTAEELADIELEKDFYKLLCGHEEYEIVVCPNSQGDIPKMSMLKTLMTQLKDEGAQLLVKHTNRHGYTSTILNHRTMTTGLCRTGKFFCYNA